MNDQSPSSSVGPKVHPATRPVEPEDPMSLHAVEVFGDPQVMLQLLVEEYARMGCGLDVIMELARDPFYQAFHGLLQLFGEQEFRSRVSAIIGRCGVMRVNTTQTEPPPAELVQLDVPAAHRTEDE